MINKSNIYIVFILISSNYVLSEAEHHRSDVNSFTTFLTTTHELSGIAKDMPDNSAHGKGRINAITTRVNSTNPEMDPKVVNVAESEKVLYLANNLLNFAETFRKSTKLHIEARKGGLSKRFEVVFPTSNPTYEQIILYIALNEDYEKGVNVHLGIEAAIDAIQRISIGRKWLDRERCRKLLAILCGISGADLNKSGEKNDCYL